MNDKVEIKWMLTFFGLVAISMFLGQILPPDFSWRIVVAIAPVTIGGIIILVCLVRQLGSKKEH